MFRSAAVAIVVALSVATVQPVAAQAVNCDTTGKVLYARDVMDDFYYWYDRMPAVDFAQYDSPEAYLEAVALSTDR